MGKVQVYIFTFLRVYLGAFNLAGGINYFFGVWPQPIPADPTGAAYMQVTLHLGLFQVAKALEITGGLCLLLNLFVPLALILLVPVTVTIFIMNAFFSPLAHVVASVSRNFAFQVVLMAGYWGYYRQLLVPWTSLEPLWASRRAALATDSGTRNNRLGAPNA